MEWVKIVGMCVVGACVYGIAHDQVTARVCVEYFTIGHPRIVETESPLVLGVVWGVVATWWMGAIAGVIVAGAARLGRRPRTGARQIARGLVVVLAAVGVVALLGGMIGRMAAEAGRVWLVGGLAEHVPADRHVDFLTVLWAHVASYVGGVVGMLGLAGWTVRSRVRGGEAACPSGGAR